MGFHGQEHERGKHVNLSALATQLSDRLLLRGPTRDEYEKTKAEVANFTSLNMLCFLS